MEIARIVFLAAVVAYTAVAAFTDWRTRRLPNALTVAGCVAGLLFHLIAGFVDGGWSGALSGLGFSAGGFGTGFGILLVLWLIGGGGGGDVKFFGSLGAWLGAWVTIKVLIASTVLIVIGGVFVVIGVFFRSGFSGVRGKLKVGQNDTKKKSKKNQDNSPEANAKKRRLIPFGVPAAFGTWIILAAEILIQSQQAAP